MSLDTKFEVHSNYLHFYCQGVYELQAMLNALSKAFEFAASNNTNSILVDMTELSGTEPTTMDRYKLSSHAVELAFKHGHPLRIAAVGNLPMIDRAKFTETVARNRGLNARAFTNLDEAIDWLMGAD